jgi:hypothetical protein
VRYDNFRQGEKHMSRINTALTLILILTFCIWIQPCTAASTELHIVKYASDRSTILSEKTLTYQQMRDTLPVLGDGITHYYHQGPVFVDDSSETTEQQLRLNPAEDTNVLTKDMGAVKGTDVRDLCELVGGMAPGDTVSIKAADGISKTYSYKNVYSPPSRQGPLVITWYCAGLSSCTGPYPDTGYSDGMRLVFFADNSVNPWGKNVFGNFDWHESAEPSDWYYYLDGAEKYPTTTGLSVKYISELQIYSTVPPGSSSPGSGGGAGGMVLPVSGSAPPDNPALYGYKGKHLTNVKSGTLNGSIRFISDPGAVTAVANNRIRNYNLTVDVPPGSNVTLARMYIYISRSHDIQTKKGIIPLFYTVFNTQHVDVEKVYIDTDGDDDRSVAATYSYDVLPLINGNGTYGLSIRNLDPEQSLFTIEGVLLVMIFENDSSPVTRYWINEGCDVISSIPEKNLFPKDCKTDYPFAEKINMSTVQDADLYLISTGLDQDNTTEHMVKFNKGIWHNIFNGTAALAMVHLPVTQYINETGNVASVESSIFSQDADYLINRNAILIIQDKDPSAPVSSQNTNATGRDQKAPLTDISDPLIARNENNYCQLALDTDPEGALIYVDGSYVGKTTPYTFETQRNQSRTIRFELDGYQPSETTVIPANSGIIRTSLYAPVHSTKGRLSEIPEDPDGIRYGGLYVSSRPKDATIFIDGIYTGKKTPSAIMGLEPGKHTVRVVRELSDAASTGKSEFTFEDQSVFVLQGVLVPVDINGIGNTQMDEIIIDSRHSRGLPFTLDGYLFNSTIPAKVRASRLHSFLTIRENESYISYPIPLIENEDRYWLINPRDYQILSISVDTEPRGAQVFIDGFRTGFTTPYTFGNLSDGPHRIMVTKEGYIPQQSLIELPRRSVPISTTSIDFVLDEYPSGFLYVNSNPQGGEVSIDGVYSGEITPALFRSIPTGSHMVQVSRGNMTRTFYDLTITSLEMANITMEFSQ